VNLDNDGLWGVVDYLDSTLAAPVAAVAINYRFLTRGRLYRDIPLRERKFERLRPKIEGHFGILKKFFEEKKLKSNIFSYF
jgi:6-phosphogluconate dehydrogenase (decarboxylating)